MLLCFVLLGHHIKEILVQFSAKKKKFTMYKRVKLLLPLEPWPTPKKNQLIFLCYFF